MNEAEAREILDGVILSDGSLRLPHGGKNAYFRIDLSKGVLHLDWILQIKEALLALGIGVSGKYPYVRPATSRGKPYESLNLYSLQSSYLTEMHHSWYSEDSKILPHSFQLSDRIIANWFMGDGTSGYVYDNIATTHVLIVFATHKFRVDEVDTLVCKLHALGIAGAHRYVHSGRPEIIIKQDASIDSIMNIMAPHMCRSFAYKVKRPCRNSSYYAALRKRLEATHG